MAGRRGNPLILRKILPNPDLVIASAGADIGFYIVSLVGQVIVKAGPDCPEIDGDFCHQIAGKPAGSSLPPAGLIHENSHSNTTFTA